MPAVSADQYQRLYQNHEYWKASSLCKQSASLGAIKMAYRMLRIHPFTFIPGTAPSQHHASDGEVEHGRKQAGHWHGNDPRGHYLEQG